MKITELTKNSFKWGFLGITMVTGDSFWLLVTEELSIRHTFHIHILFLGEHKCCKCHVCSQLPTTLCESLEVLRFTAKYIWFTDTPLGGGRDRTGS